MGWDGYATPEAKSKRYGGTDHWRPKDEQMAYLETPSQDIENY